jgi:GNAT superfamily N-acetyltransferase
LFNSRKIDTFKILSGYENTKQFVASVNAAADDHRNEFGFLADSVYEEFARNNCLYVLVDCADQEPVYCGHLLFSQRYPRARVVQMFVLKQYRRHQLASRLINYFCSELTDKGFTSVYASVAEDLQEANAFWGKHQFHIQKMKKGGEARRRVILCRCRELDSPQLFPTSGMSTSNPLGLAVSSSAAVSMFLLDLNVLFDLSGPRRTRHSEAVGLFQIERLNLCKLAVSNEARKELHRTATPGKLDPMEGVIDVLPSFPLSKSGPHEQVFKDLAAIVFPAKQELSANDKSDLLHIATAVQHGLSGLITRDEALLSAGKKIQDAYGVSILSPDAFVLNEFTSQESSYEGEDDKAPLVLRSVEVAEYSSIHALLGKQNITASQIASEWLPTGANGRVVQRFAVWAKDTAIGYVTWALSARAATISARIVVDMEHFSSSDAARIMLTYLVEQQPQQGPRQINLEIPPSQAVVREAAISFGFHGSPKQSEFCKIMLGGVMTPDSWGMLQSKLLSNSNIKLPDSIPLYQHQNQQIQVITPDQNRRFITLDELESLLSPALLCLPGRPAVIVPIQRRFSEPLLGHSEQASLLPESRVSLYQERRYISASKTLRYFKRGTLVLFYESKGRGALIAIARVRHAYLKPADDIQHEDLEHSVLTRGDVRSIGKANVKTITEFDNIFKLPCQVPLATLRVIGCGEAHQLLSTHPISDKQLQGILHEAFNSTHQ